MKKLLSLLTITTLATTAGTTTVACEKNHTGQKEKGLKEYQDELLEMINKAENTNTENWKDEDKMNLVHEIAKANAVLKSKESSNTKLKAATKQLKWQIQNFTDKYSKKDPEIKEFSRLITWATTLYNKSIDNKDIKLSEKELKKEQCILDESIKNAELSYTKKYNQETMKKLAEACNKFVEKTGMTN